MDTKLILENGMTFEAKSFGYKESVVGELVFTTSMTGYQEVLTDPSYYGQIVILTYPLVGNYGLNLEDNQSDTPKVRGFIVKEEAKLPNNFRCEMSLRGYLKENKIVGLKGLDTRFLTKTIRDKGVMKAIITPKELYKSQIKGYFDNFSNTNAAREVTRKEPLEIVGQNKKIAIIDCGIKQNIIDSFAARGCHLKIFPLHSTFQEIEEFNPDGVFISNGPGNPEDLPEVIEVAKEVIEKQIPLIGICLGHQIIALALGGKIEKMKFGHRGSNHPVKDVEKGKIFITSQNHGYVISKLPPNVKLSHTNLNDDTIAGIKDENRKIFSVQFHPEACPGPKESVHIFDEFLEVIQQGKKS